MRTQIDSSVATNHRPRTTDGRHHFVTLLSIQSIGVVKSGKELHEVPIAVTGSWVKGERKFSITRQDLADMARNFAKRKNEQVVIDYEHASEMPEIARGGPIPAAGWIHSVSIVHRPFDAAKKPGAGDGLAVLQALVEWTPDAKELIHKGAYRFFSPAIDWEARDKETGQPQGATLTSGALTNHPFLEELPPIMLTASGHEFRFSSFDFRTARPEAPRALADTSNASLDKPLKNISVAPGNPGQGGTMKKLSMQKQPGAAGRRSVFDDNTELGEIDLADLDLDDGEFEELAARCGRKLDDDASDASDASDALSDRRAALFAARVGAPGLSLGEIRERLAFAENVRGAADPDARAVLLAEAVRKGKLDNARAAMLAREGRITLADYIAAQEAEKAVELAVLQGKILPRDRGFYFRDALERPREFSEWTRTAPRVLMLDSLGFGSGQVLSVDDEINARVRSAQKEDPKLNYSQAFTKVLASDKDLASRYHAAHRRHAPDDQPPAAA